jgi:hypothetical protein
MDDENIVEHIETDMDEKKKKAYLRVKKSREENREAYNAYHREYMKKLRQTNPEKLCEKNREYLKQWRIRNGITKAKHAEYMKTWYHTKKLYQVLPMGNDYFFSGKIGDSD